MKQLLLTTIAALVLVGCGPSGSIHETAATNNIEVVKQDIAEVTDANGEDGEPPSKDPIKIIMFAITSIVWAIAGLYFLREVIHGLKFGRIETFSKGSGRLNVTKKKESPVLFYILLSLYCILVVLSLVGLCFFIPFLISQLSN